MLTARQKIQKRTWRTRSALRKKANGRLRLSVHRTSKHIYAQVIDDKAGVTLASCSTLDKELRTKLEKGYTVEAATAVGKELAVRAKKAGVDTVVFDRGSFRFHGRVKAIADAAREGGLSF